MITNLKKVDPEIEPGRVIEVVDYRVRNYRLHSVLEQLGRLLLFSLECDSNNTSSKNLPSDTREILSQWKIVKDEFDFSLAHNDFPHGIYEYAYTICLPTGKEIQKIRNVKIKRVFTEVFNSARVLLSIDSANSQGYIAAEDASKVKVIFGCVDDVMLRWIGAGDEGDLGLVAPAYETLGVLVPDVDSDYATILEPSANMPKPKLDDVPDVDEASKK